MTTRRRGFTLVEIVVSLVIAGIIGGAFMRLLMNQNRYFSKMGNVRGARRIARGASNILLADLRMVQDSGGVDSVTSDGKLIRILVPYRFGLVCGTNATTTTVSMLPTDSGTIAVSVYKGFAWRDSTTRLYSYNWPNNPTGSDIPQPAGNTAICTGNGAGQAQIRSLSVAGRTSDILDLHTNSASGARVGAPLFFFQRITYSFRTSGVYPGRMGLWRNVDGGRNEEIMSPFDTAAGFRFYESGKDVPDAVPPAAPLIRGVDLVLSAVGPRAVSGDTSSSQSKVVTSVFFKNVRRF
jgi:prepilin-type N-terminal cleavage/methylation domain-containing protein